MTSTRRNEGRQLSRRVPYATRTEGGKHARERNVVKRSGVERNDEERTEGERNDDESAIRAATERAVRAVQAGRREAFAVIFEEYHERAYRYFRRRGFSEEEAEDHAQEAMARVYRGLGGFRFESTFDTWFLGLLANVLRNAFRHRSTLEERVERVPLDRLVEEPKHPADDPESAFLAREVRESLRAAVDELAPQQRQVLLLRHQGWSYAEIADMLDIARSTVKKTLSTARRNLEPIVRRRGFSDLLA